MFVAVIDTDRHKYIWSKVITSLSSLSDNVKFIIKKNSLSLSAVNSAKTSNGEIIFKKSFFHEYEAVFESGEMIEGYETNDDGYEDEDEKETFSFIVNAKHLAILFKNLDILDLDYICLKIHWNLSSEFDDNLKYKLLIEIKTKKLILKKFQAGFQPVLRNEVEVAKHYQEEFKDDPASGLVNYIKVEQVILKQFLDMIPGATEDFKIEQRADSIQFSGFTKQVIKDREYLKQPMSVTISISIDELLDTNLNGRDIDGVMFRLKDFKNYINLITSFSDGNKNNDLNYSSDDYFEIMFKKPGDPILFELNNNQHLTIQFIQITNGVDSTDTTSTKGVLKSHVFHKIQSLPQSTSTSNSAITKPAVVEDDAGQLFLPELSQPEFTPDPEGVTYDNINRKRKEATPAPNLEDTEYEETEGEKEEETEGKDEYGPTQGIKRPKSIFD